MIFAERFKKKEGRVEEPNVVSSDKSTQGRF